MMTSDLQHLEAVTAALNAALSLLNHDPELCGELSEEEQSWHATLARAQHYLVERRGQCSIPFPEIEDDAHV